MSNSTWDSQRRTCTFTLRNKRKLLSEIRLRAFFYLYFSFRGQLFNKKPGTILAELVLCLGIEVLHDWWQHEQDNHENDAEDEGQLRIVRTLRECTSKETHQLAEDNAPKKGNNITHINSSFLKQSAAGRLEVEDYRAPKIVDGFCQQFSVRDNRKLLPRRA